jgi:hypothetical protein
MDTPRNLTPHRGPSVWANPPEPSPYGPIVALAAVAVAAGLAWRYRSIARTIVTGSAGVGALVVGFITSPTGRKVANILMDQWAQARRPADAVVDTALEESFPASDPPALSFRA